MYHPIRNILLLIISIFFTILCKAQSNDNEAFNKYCKAIIHENKYGKIRRYRQISRTYYYSNKDSVYNYGINTRINVTNDKSSIASKDTIVDVVKVLSISELTYIGDIIDAKKNIFKIVTNFERWGDINKYPTNAKGASFIYVFNDKSHYLGKYRVDDLPIKIKNNVLCLGENKYSYYPSFDNGIPNTIYLIQGNKDDMDEVNGIPFKPKQ